MNEIRKVEGSDPLMQSLFGASIAALYSKQVNSSVMKDVGNFIKSFEKSNQSLLASADTLKDTLETIEPVKIEPRKTLETPAVVNDETTIDTDESVSTDTTNARDLTVDTDEETTPEASTQFKAANDFVNKLNDTIKFLKDNNRSKKTELLAKRLNYDFEQKKDELKAIGLTQNESGKFEISEADFEKALSQDSEQVKEVLSGRDGFTTKVESRITDASKVPASRFAYDDVSELTTPYSQDSYAISANDFSRDDFSQQLQLQSMMQKGSILNMLI